MELTGDFESPYGFYYDGDILYDDEAELRKGSFNADGDTLTRFNSLVSVNRYLYHLL